MDGIDRGERVQQRLQAGCDVHTYELTHGQKGETKTAKYEAGCVACLFEWNVKLTRFEGRPLNKTNEKKV